VAADEGTFVHQLSLAGRTNSDIYSHAPPRCAIGRDGLPPSKILTCLSHYHYDHTANANSSLTRRGWLDDGARRHVCNGAPGTTDRIPTLN